MADKPDELGKEIGDFLDEGAPAKPVVDPPADPPVVDPPAAAPAPVVDPPVDPPAAAPVDPPVDPPVEPAKPVEPVVDPVAAPAVPPVTDPLVVAPVVVPAAPAVAPLTEREKLLIERIEKVTGKELSVDEALTVEPAAPATPATPAAPAAPVTPEPTNFLGDVKLDDYLDDPVKFNELLVKVQQSGVDLAQKAAVGNVFKSLPQLVIKYVAQQAKMSEIVGDFYKANQDLVGVKKTVAAVANDVAAENADWTVEKVFTETADRTRKVLGLTKGAAPPVAPVEPGAPAAPAGPAAPADPNNPEPSPAFVDQGGRGPAPVALKGLEADINDLITD